MLCRTCEESIQRGDRRRPRSRRVPDQLCACCGDLLGHEEIELHARRKKSQLEKFGLAGRLRLLLRRKDSRR
jgi:hypothetical protein